MDSKVEFKHHLLNKDIISKLRVLPIEKGDFFLIPAGTVHAIRKNTMIYEVQQNSDTTYRVYDYNRKDSQGNKRELHIDQALEVINFPNKAKPSLPTISSRPNSLTMKYTDNDYFSVYRIDIKGQDVIELEGEFSIIGLIEGNFKINEINFKNGEHALVTNETKKLKVKGEGSIILTIPNENTL